MRRRLGVHMGCLFDRGSHKVVGGNSQEEEII